MSQDLSDQLVDGAFIKIERQASFRLLRYMPTGEMDTDDASAWVRFYALEATRVFDVERGAKFSTFLYAHLRQRGLEMWRRAWSQTRRPPGGFCQFFDTPAESPPPSSQLEIIELMGTLTHSTRSTLRMILHYHTNDLRAAFTKRTYKSQVQKETGIEKADVESFVQELRRKIPTHLSTVEV